MIRSSYHALAGLVVAAALVSPTVSPTVSPALDHVVQTGVERPRHCFEPARHGAAPGDAARSVNPRSGDHRTITAAQQRAIDARTRALLARRTVSTTDRVTVPVYVHVMTSRTGAGNVSDTRIRSQVAVLNKTYAGEDPDGTTSPDTGPDTGPETGPDTGFRFRLAGIDRFRNSTWHADGDSETYRSKTRRGGRTALNVWLVDFDYLGIATFPWDDASAPAIDGVRIQFSSLPGGSAAHYAEGKTLTHETGHWLGLFHTFQDGCSSPGDEVADTPAQASPSTGCPEGRDSCSAKGLDPIHDYMDYSYDACYRSFSPGQVTRMKQMWTAYRK
ncbi:MAG: zinc metalloprotease [Marmoricola sp.]